MMDEALEVSEETCRGELSAEGFSGQGIANNNNNTQSEVDTRLDRKDTTEEKTARLEAAKQYYHSLLGTRDGGLTEEFREKITAEERKRRTEAARQHYYYLLRKDKDLTAEELAKKIRQREEYNEKRKKKRELEQELQREEPRKEKLVPEYGGSGVAPNNSAVQYGATEASTCETDITPTSSVPVIDLNTPPNKRRRAKKGKNQYEPVVPAPTTNDNAVDLVDSSPYVPDVRRAELTIELSENDKTGHLVLIDCTTSGLVLKRLTVSPMFRDSASKLEAGLTVLKGPDERKATTECVKMILRLGSTKDSIESLEADLSGHDIHELLHNGAFLTDSPIDYYRCLLIREEMKRALIFHQDKWGRSWIQTTFFISLLLKKDEEKNRFVDYDAVKMIERRFLGNRNSNFEIYEDNAPHFFLLV